MFVWLSWYEEFIIVEECIMFDIKIDLLFGDMCLEILFNFF